MSWKDKFWIISTSGGCGGPERSDFSTISTLRGSAGPERTVFNN